MGRVERRSRSSLSVWFAVGIVALALCWPAQAAIASWEDPEMKYVETTVEPTPLHRQNGTSTGQCDQKSSTWLGFVCAAVAILFFGTNYIPVKEIDTGDGMFFQWIVCMGIWLSGLVIHVAKGFPSFQPLAMVGGALWATGNITVVPIVKMIGLGMGLLVWGMANLVFGWASARFGILGVSEEAPCSNLLNSLGVTFCVLGLVAYFFVKSEGKRSDPSETTHLLSSKFSSSGSIQNMGGLGEDDQSWTDKLSPGVKRALAYSMALVAGALYGVNFNPVTHLQQTEMAGNDPNVTINHGDTWALDYVFSHWCGILLTSTVYFLLYSAVMRSRPRIYPRAVLPGILSGVMWAIADASWFIANERLSQAIAYPIITTGPGIIAALIGIFYYKEIRGRKNFIFFSIAFLLTVVGVLFTSFSKMYNTKL